MTDRRLDCVLIGYNEVPFERYEALLRGYGEDSEAYRDLRFSFLDLAGRKMLYPEVMNYATHLAAGGGAAEEPEEVFVSGEIPNLAAAYLTNFLRRRDLAVEYVNLFQQEKERLGELLDRNPLAVAITTTFYVINLPVIEMVEFIRQRNPEVKIVIGGPLVSNHVRNYAGAELEAALEDLGGDYYIVEAQGEATLEQLLRTLRDGGDPGIVPNLVYPEEGGLRRTVLQPEANDMNENVIDWADLAAGDDLGPTLQTRTARSCAFKCAFCNYPTRAGKLTLTSVERIEWELDRMAGLGNVENVVFIDDTFNVPLPRFKDICRLMIDKGYGFNWFSYFRCSNSDEEAVELMAESGCKGVFLGIESGSPSILKNMNKRATVEQYLAGIQMLKDAGVVTFGSFITGFPGESETTAQETLDFIQGSGLDFFRSQLWYCEPGTPILQRRDEFGIEGDGFVWSHDTMDSMGAMDWIDRMFLTIDGPVWLPQWSFDFWIIPYLMGKGLSVEQMKDFCRKAQGIMALDVAFVPEAEKRRRQEALWQELVDVSRSWAPAVAGLSAVASAGNVSADGVAGR